MSLVRSAAASLVALAAAACSGPGPDAMAEGALARVGLENLTHADLAAAMPAGLSPDDYIHAFDERPFKHEIGTVAPVIIVNQRV